jgi:hypothetical protein
MISVLERAKTVRALDRAATAIGRVTIGAIFIVKIGLQLNNAIFGALFVCPCYMLVEDFAASFGVVLLHLFSLFACRTSLSAMIN